MIEILVGLNVLDHDGYQAYREKMTPLLTNVGGHFRYDFTIAQTLKSETDHKINRVFVIRFPDVESKDKLFKSDEYQQIKQQFFEKSVQSTTIISEYERESEADLNLNRQEDDDE